MLKKLLSTSSMVQQSLVSYLSVEECFPENAHFIRPLNVNDDEAIANLLERSGTKPHQVYAHYGIFDERNKLMELYADYRNAIHNYGQNEHPLCWMH